MVTEAIPIGSHLDLVMSVLLSEADRLANSTVASIVRAKEAGLDDVGVLLECCSKLQEVNAHHKASLASMDATAAYEAMKGGLTGIGCDDAKLIRVLCTRSKAALKRTAAAYREQRAAASTERPKDRAAGDSRGDLVPLGGETSPREGHWEWRVGTTRTSARRCGRRRRATTVG